MNSYCERPNLRKRPLTGSKGTVWPNIFINLNFFQYFFSRFSFADKKMRSRIRRFMCRTAVHRMHNYWIVCRIIRPWNSIDWLKSYSRPADICSTMTASSKNKFATTPHSSQSSMVQLRSGFFSLYLQIDLASMNKHVREFCPFIICRRAIYSTNVRPSTDPMWKDWTRIEDCCPPNMQMDCIRYLADWIQYNVIEIGDIRCHLEMNFRSIRNCRNRKMLATNFSFKRVQNQMSSTLKWPRSKVWSMLNAMWRSFNGRSSSSMILSKRCSKRWVSGARTSAVLWIV